MYIEKYLNYNLRGVCNKLALNASVANILIRAYINNNNIIMHSKNIVKYSGTCLIANHVFEKCLLVSKLAIRGI